MIRLSIAIALLGSLLAAPAFAGHEYLQASFRGTLETDVDDDGRVERTRITEAFFLSDPANFLVVYLDIVPSNTEFQLEEWSDGDMDGIPDTFVSLIATKGALSAFRNPADTQSKFTVQLSPNDLDLDNDGTEDFNGGTVCTGSAKTDGSSALRFSCKLSGPAHDEFTAGEGNFSTIKGTIKSVGDAL